MKQKIVERIIFNLLFLFFFLQFNIFIQFIILVLALFYFNFFIEIIVWAFIFDMIYGKPVESLYNFSFIYTLIAVFVFLILNKFKKNVFK